MSTHMRFHRPPLTVRLFEAVAVLRVRRVLKSLSQPQRDAYGLDPKSPWSANNRPFWEQSSRHHQ